ncbi:MAG TPA: diacylglycerol kinase family protein [Gemmatimonadales bacterium]|nr:diacylglycerol kinase family protein [Gemmatimonadales bacterium]
MMRVTLVHNPGAGDERHSAERLLKELAQAGHKGTVVGKDDLAESLEDPGDLVAVAGGDGTIKKVAIALAGRGVPMAILPLGTANNIARSLGVRGSVAELVAGWAASERRRLAVGTVATRWGAMRFVESVGVGVFTELVSRGETEVDDNTGLTGHALDRALLLLQRIVAERKPRARVLTLDGTDASGEYLLVQAMNIPMVGPNVPLAPGADWGDGQLDVVTVTEQERPVLAEYVRARLAGGAAPPELTVRRAARVTLSASTPELQVDDGPWSAVPESTERRSGNGAGERPEEGYVRITLGDRAVDVLVGPPGAS